MASLSYERHCAEIVAQTALLRTRIEGADVSVPVPTCPGWSLARLVRHLGEAHRTAEAAVRNGAPDPAGGPPAAGAPGYDHADAATLGAWLTEGAGRLAETLRAAGPDAVAGAAPEGTAPVGTAAFWARRMAHETVVHRADATFATAQAPGGTAAAERPFAVVEDVAVDALDEWLTFATRPEVVARLPRPADVLGPGRTLRLQADDGTPEAAPDWLVVLAPDGVTWQRPPAPAGPATTTVRGPLSELLLLVYGRLPLLGAAPGPVGGTGAVVVHGEIPPLHAWLAAAGRWHRE
ncbi:maleylpyruvate isomerase N-terminal domain-containing protein [Streptomyces sp. RS10V-4]|uniref:maleylpyruvate isomerase N-terminal domain-containing protein n=1 Tax=Streptomyces rhizoryzae TaxID=2932493 RepID=UPI00200410AF|nr:maleylpyruvate isomerase N-terminal domain-containing protein [Streptomyces rhizoryzae]MCK7624574.1 maleylpyruvate isomerase N-terminal domain-containing protein [Streptomyces rhizoryzae]